MTRLARAPGRRRKGNFQWRENRAESKAVAPPLGTSVSSGPVSTTKEDGGGATGAARGAVRRPAADMSA
eukprot:scaffold1376_cov257-Pinguiococcus_pyrenoidosus.AAC.30